MQKDFGSDFRNKAFDRARRGVAEAFSKKDASLIQATRALDDLDSIKSLMSQRLAEWTGANFPEYSLKNDENTARVYALCGSKEEFAKHEEKLAEIVGAPKARELVESAAKSYGVEFTKTEREAVQTLASLTATVYEERGALQEFVEANARENARNISTLIEPLLAARLISLAGGLEKLAKMSASTIQVIGAEKALFKHLRTGTQPPKHGLIFQSPLINGAPLYQRGKIARALATKLSIAAKADWFTGNFIAEKLKAILDARLKQIREGPQPSEEKKRELRANEQRRQAERQREWQNSRPQRNPPRGGFRQRDASSRNNEQRTAPREEPRREAGSEQRNSPRETPRGGEFRGETRREFGGADGASGRGAGGSGASGGERREFMRAGGNAGVNGNREFRKRDGERRDYSAGGSHERREYGHGERTPSGERGGFEHQNRGGGSGGFRPSGRPFGKFNKFRKKEFRR